MAMEAGNSSGTTGTAGTKLFENIFKYKGINFINNKYADDPIKMENMKCRDDDVIVATLPKSGTTFTQEITWLVLHDADPKSRDGKNFDERMPEIGYSLHCSYPGSKYVPRDEMESPRIFKTHYPWRTLPREAKEKKCKIIYVSRNFKDVVVSGYFMFKDLYLVPIYPGNKYVPRDEMESPRIFKTHYPWRTLPREAKEKKCKIIYVSRNFKDVVVSGYFMFKDLYLVPMSAGKGANKTAKSSTDLLVSTDSIRSYFNQMAYDQVIFGNYFEHNLEYWEQRDSGHVLFLLYEDLVEDLAGGVRRIAEFLGKQLSDDQVSAIVAETNFERMRTNPLTNWNFTNRSRTAGPLTKNGLRDPNAAPIMRKGKVGDWKNYFDDEMSDIADALCRKHFEPVNLKHRFE
ncbi:PREDICTED: estrogen sulfotransferase-like [Priapulus caudatus]|uniref:Estrogen sulfotransferase-like n=1 Tax=Priapulus caudatus TaxID=37621 RepID=A0ABM1EHC2_PRICU|nr:PREDICTED: estrogen sulfotransferase-like [Priapulus caudatus]